MKIAFITQNTSRFVMDDYEIFKQLGYEVNLIARAGTIGRTWRHSFLDKINPMFFIRTLIAVYKSDVVYSWFAHQAAFYAKISSKIFNKPFIVVTGGFDVAVEPDVNYGLLIWKPHYRKIVKFIFEGSKVISMAKSGKKEAENVGGKCEPVYLGVDTNKFHPIKDIKKCKRVITVAPLNKTNILRKGVGTFFKCLPLVVKKHPDIEFMHIGDIEDDYVKERILNYCKKKGILKNVKFYGFVNNDKELNKIYNESMIKFQVSGHEGFGLAMAEAMAAELPILGSVRGSIPEVVGPGGLFAEFDNKEDCAEKIIELLDNPEMAQSLGELGRKHIIENFTFDKRKQNLKRIIEEVS